MQAGRPIQKDRFGPRFGFAYALNDRTVIRGGSGKYFADVSDQVSSWTERYGTGEINAQVANDGRANFAGGPVERKRSADLRGRRLLIPGLRKSVSQIATPGLQVPYSYQSSIGFQRQLGSDMGVEADYVVQRQPGRAVPEEHQSDLRPGHRGAESLHERRAGRASRLGNGERIPLAGMVQLSRAADGIHEALQSAVAGFGHVHARRPSGTAPRRRPRRSTWSRISAGSTRWRVTDQRHRAVVNGIWDVGHGLQLSGLYFYGSGQRFATTYGGGDRPGLRTAAPRRLAPSCRATTSSETRFTGWISGSTQRVELGGRTGWTASSRCSTCSTARTTAPTRPLKAMRTMESRFRILVSRISRAWCNWDSGSYSDSHGWLRHRLRGPFAVYRASIRLSSRRFRVQMNSASPNSFV